MVYIGDMDGGGRLFIPFSYPANIHPLNVMNRLNISSQELGQKFHKFARIAATIIVFIYVISRDLINLAYTFGYETGKCVHELNNKLSEISVEISERNWGAIASRFVIQTPVQSAPAFCHPLTQIAEEIETLTVSEIKNILGTKKKAKKQQLIEMVLAG